MRHSLKSAFVSVILLTLVAVHHLLATKLLSAADRQSAPAKKENSVQRQWEQMALFDEAVPSPDQDAEVQRKIKNRRYNCPYPAIKLTRNGFDSVIRNVDGPVLNVLPFRESVLVLLGTIKSVQPYLSEDESDVYSEYKVQVEEIFKNSIASLLGDRLKTEITVDCAGGALRLRSGKIVRVFIPDRDMPKSDCQYVLFIKLIHEGIDLDILTAFRIDGNSVKSLRKDPRTQIYDTQDSKTFLDQVRREAKMQ